MSSTNGRRSFRLALASLAGGQLGQPKSLLIFGPGEAKLELKERLSRSKTLSGRTVDIETVDKLTDRRLWRR
jgi:hypothetical protein